MTSIRPKLHPWLEHDFFVSYTRRDEDAPGYAIRLANRLRERYDVFLDEDGLEAGMRIEELERKVRRSAVLVVLASPNLAESLYVPREVAAAAGAGRLIIAIDIARTLAEKRAGAALQPVFEEVSWIDEPVDLRSGPSPYAVERAARSLSGLRRRTWRTLRAVLAAVGIVALLAYLGIVSQGRASQRRLSNERTEQAERQSHARQLTLASSLSRKDPLRAAAILDDSRACPPERRDMTWAILRKACDPLRWTAPMEWGALAAARWLSANELVLAGVDGRVHVWDLGEERETSGYALEPGTSLLDVDPRRRRMAFAREEDGHVELRTVEGLVALEFPAFTASDIHSPVRGRFLAGGSKFAVLTGYSAALFSTDDGRPSTQENELVARVIEEAHEDAFTRLIDLVELPDETASLLFLCNTSIEESRESSLRAAGTAGAVLALDTLVGSRLIPGAVAASDRICVLTRHEDTATSLGGIGFVRHTGIAELFTGAAREPGRRQRDRLRRLEVPGADATALALDKGGRRLFVGARSGALGAYDLERDEATFTFAASGTELVDLRLSDDGARVAALDGAGELRVWTTAPGVFERGETLDTLSSTLTRKIRTLTRSPCGWILYTAQALNPDGGGDAQVFDPRTIRWRDLSSWSPFLSAGIHPRVRAGDLEQPGELLRLRAVLPAASVSMGAAGARPVVYEGSGRRLERMDLEANESSEPPPRSSVATREFEEESGYLLDCVASPAGDRVAVAWLPLSTDDERDPLFDLEAANASLASREGETRVEIWPRAATADGTRLGSGLGRPDTLSWSPSGSWVGCSFPGGHVRAWRSSDLTRLAFAHDDRPDSRVWCLAFMNDERTLVALIERADGTSLLRWLDLEDGGIAHESSFGDAPPTRLCLRPDGRAAAVGFRNGDVAVVEREGDRVQRFPGDADTSVASIEFSDDGRTLLRVSVSSSGWGASALCDGVTGQPLLDLEAEGVAMDCATFLPESTGVIAIGKDDRVYVFHAWNPPE